MLKFILSLFSLVFLCCPILTFGSEYYVSSTDEFNELSLSPGDVVIWNNGTYNEDGKISFSVSGTSAMPIILKAETPGGVIFTGELTVDISGDYVYMDGFYWKEGAGTNNHVQFREGSTYANYSGIRNCAFNNLTPEGTDKHRWVVLYGTNNTVENCSFLNKNSPGALVLVELEYNDYNPVSHKIINNYFYNYVARDPTTTHSGDSETIRVGTSEFQDKSASVLVENNYFQKTDGENEIITNKSADNTYKHNTFRNCSGSLVLRHGANAAVEGNFFLGENKEGSGGIRVTDSNHIIINNYMQGLNNEDDSWNNGITLVGGSDTSGGTTNGYQKVDNILVAFNTIYNSDNPLYYNDRSSYDPTGIFAYNLISSENGTLVSGDISGTGQGIVYEGNIFDGSDVGISDSGITEVSVNFSSDGEIFKPDSSSPVANAASTSYSDIVTIDLEGLGRSDDMLDVGAHEVSGGTGSAVYEPHTDAMVGSIIGACFVDATGSHITVCSNTIDNSITIPSEVTFDASGDTQIITISSNIELTVSESASWMALNTLYDSNTSIITITVELNTNTADRTADINISGDGATHTITVLQNGASVGVPLDSNNPPSSNFDLSKWYLGVPIDRGDGISTSIDVETLNGAYELKDVGERDYFYTGDGGAMVFRNYPKDAPKTSKNTSYSRTELREMLYGDDKGTKDPENNWYFSSSTNAPSAAGGIDGKLTATLKVNSVTTTATSEVQKGRIIVGQIHASTNEPNRLYYHKLPSHDKGAIYVAHETFNGDEVFYNIIGDYVEETGDKAGDLKDNPSSPTDGIALNEEFSYIIEVIGNDQWVTISRPGKDNLVQYIDMSESGYEDDWMYFKAGVYSQNKTCQSNDEYDQVSFYALEQSHFNESNVEELVISNVSTFSSLADFQILNVSSNIDWTVSENSSWITIDKTSGSDNDTITISVSENTATEDRTAEVTVTGAGIARTVTVTQEAYEEPLASGTCLEGTNLSLGASIVDFSEEQNDTNHVGNLIDGNIENRWSAQFYPQYVVIDLGDAYAIDEINLIPYQERAYQFLVEGSLDSATTNYEILTDANTNTGEEAIINRTFSNQKVRYVKLTITGVGGDTSEWSSLNDFQVICSGETISDTLEVFEINNFEATQETQTVAITSNIDWIVSENTDWITLSSFSGSDNGLFDITVSENTEIAQRAAEVTVTGGSITRIITIIQEGKTNSILEVSTLNTFTSEGENKSLTVTSNIDWIVATTDDWIRVTNTTQTGDGYFTVMAIENTQIGNRTGTVTVTGGGITKVITIVQEGIEVILEVSDLMDYYAQESSQSLRITSNTTWELSTTPDWISLDISNGVEDGTVIITVNENPSTDARSGEILLEANGIILTISINQEGSAEIIEITDISTDITFISPNPFIDSFNVYLGEDSYDVSSIQIIDVLGRLIDEKQRLDDQTSVQFEGYYKSNALYFVRFMDSSQNVIMYKKAIHE